MGKTKIEWASHTWNPLRVRSGGFGCTKISPGCQNCYAGRMNRWRFKGRDYDYQYKPSDFYLDEKAMEAPLHWRKPRTVFVCSMCDLFHENVPAPLIRQVFSRMFSHSMGCMGGQKPHDFILLTKRPDVAAKYIAYDRAWRGDAIWEDDSTGWARHIYLGATVCNQPEAERIIPTLLSIPVAHRFISVEPMLGPIDLMRLPRPYRFHQQPRGWEHWLARNLGGVICGGETGPGARPIHPDWVRSLRDQCVAADMPFHFKGWGEWTEVRTAGDDPDGRSVKILSNGTMTDIGWDGGPGRHLIGSRTLYRVGKKKAGRILDGRTWDQTAWRGVKQS